MRRGLAWTLLLAAAVPLCLFFLLPLWMVLRGGFSDGQGFTLRYLGGVFQNPVYAEGLRNSFWIALGTTTLATALALPLAWLADRYDFAGKKLATGLILTPLVLPPFLGAIGFQQVFGQSGAFNALLGLGPVDWLGRAGMAGVIALEALSLYPILYLNAAAALANVDPAMEEAAENLGATGARKFFRITLPLIMPGLFAGGILVFLWSFTELGTPLLLNYTRCAPVQVFDALKDIGTDPFPFALVFVLLACSILLYSAGRLLFGRRAYAMTSKAATVSSARRLTGARRLLPLLPFLLVIGIALLPHAAVILTSFSAPGSWYRSALPADYTLANYQEALGHDLTVASIGNSLLYATLALLLTLALGVAIALVVVRSNLRLRGLLDNLSMLPLAVPGLVMAFGYLALSNELSHRDWVKDSPFWRSLLDVRSNPTLFLVIAYSIRRLPYMVRSAVAGLQQTSVTLEEAAANLGATPLATWRRITLPLISANLIAGGLLVFAFSMLEVSDSLMLAQRQDHYPITKAIFEFFQLMGTGPFLAAALGVWAMLFLALTLLGASLLLGRRMGALFRV
ncbi:MAG: iron ABC transporter permease [Planctomycetota bacterium]|nr:MAG: iron ABC transporter permease [Planctomycetota bacterium]